MQIRNYDPGASAADSGMPEPLLAEDVVRHCVDAHRDWYQLSTPMTLVVCLLWAGVSLPLMQWRFTGLSLILWPFIGWSSAFILLLVLQGLGIAPSMEGEHSHWRKFAQAQHLRTMELELPQTAHALWNARFRQHITKGEPVTVKNLVEFANELERERVNQNHLRAQQMIIDQHHPG
ncbi:hypothetical protein RQP54_18115 [Curvibacter sp. APW13]|uniref:hypothetical protein n=1 Tax=Curvibacter sp. APW13 TaxID=3077236 RepID=UPI0028DE1791|nr:hypothetical protein [Curvibacter sp. APW13]MDT8992794.1 hypothetical protein [Curvibacter sp. APW13]